MDQLEILVVHDGETCNYTSLYEEVNDCLENPDQAIFQMSFSNF
jgi:hypothetical protein